MGFTETWLLLLTLVVLIFFVWRLAHPSIAIKEAEKIAHLWRDVVVPLREEMDQLRAEIRILNTWVEMLSNQVRSLGGQPVTHDAAARSAGVMMSVFSTQYADLRRKLIELFNIEEINLLAEDIGLNHEMIKGDTITERAAELINAAHHRNLMNELIAAIKRERPKSAIDFK